ncbi:MAG: T9SS type A sorting domain-containing protein, partial [Bacteroidales bacterium]|nr:T9SS type A sorting domain-containing protein [Bacteroidales bacterium]
LVDIKGSMVDTREISVMEGNTINFDYNLRPGTYFVRIIANGNVYVEQIVVE